MTTSNSELIYERILAVMQDIGAIGKNNQNDQQHYSFRGIDDVYNALHPALIKNQVFIVPTVLNLDNSIIETGAGKRAYQTLLTCCFRATTTDGSYVEGHAVGEALDFSDKATNKAMSNAFKYFCFQLFCIPTRDMFIDAERDDIQIGDRMPPTYTAPAPPRQSYDAPPAAPTASPVAATLGDMISGKQLGMIRALAREQGIDVAAECQRLNGCAIDELSKRAASDFIGHLQSLEGRPATPEYTGAPTPPPSTPASSAPPASSGGTAAVAAQKNAITNLAKVKRIDLAAMVNLQTSGRVSSVDELSYDEAGEIIKYLQKQ